MKNTQKQTKLKVATVKMSAIEFQGLHNPETGEYRVGISQIGHLLQDGTENSVRPGHIQRSLKRNMGEGFDFEKHLTELNSKPVNTISLEQFKKVVFYFANKGNEKAIELHNNINPELPVKKRKIKNPKQKEREIQNKIVKERNGKTEVICKTGIVDILTDNEIIEVKQIKQWKHAVGQIIVYGLEFPKKEKQIVLFGETSNEAKQMIVSFCNQLNIKVVFE